MPGEFGGHRALNYRQLLPHLQKLHATKWVGYYPLCFSWDWKARILFNAEVFCTVAKGWSHRASCVAKDARGTVLQGVRFAPFDFQLLSATESWSERKDAMVAHEVEFAPCAPLYCFLPICLLLGRDADYRYAAGGRVRPLRRNFAIVLNYPDRNAGWSPLVACDVSRTTESLAALPARFARRTNWFAA
eukprot:IDg7181t1